MIPGAAPGLRAAKATPVFASQKAGEKITKILNKPIDGKNSESNRLWPLQPMTTSCSGQQPVNKFQQL